MDAWKMRDAGGQRVAQGIHCQTLCPCGARSTQLAGICGDPSSPLVSPVSPSTVVFFQPVMKIPLPLQTLPPPPPCTGRNLGFI